MAQCPAGILGLQRSAGNRAVASALAARPVPRVSAVATHPLASMHPSSVQQASVQRCGGEVHAGCPCAGETGIAESEGGESELGRPLQRVRFDDVTPTTGTTESPFLQRVPSWPDASTKNGARRTVTPFERWPVHGLSSGNQLPKHPNIPVSPDPKIEANNEANRGRIANSAGDSVEKADKRAIVYTPTALSQPNQLETPTPATTTAGVDVLFQLHGFNKGWRQSKANGTTRDEAIERIPQQLPAAMVAILPQGTELSSFGSLDVDGIAKDALASISAAWGAVPVRRVALGGHSGGGGAVAGLLATKPGKGEKPGADPAARRAQRRLPTGLSEVMLFDGINTGGQEEIVERWVLESIEEDRVALAGLTDNPAQATFPDTGMKFRATFSPGSSFYAPTHKKLKAAIDKAFLDKNRPPSVPQALWDRLKLNYQVIPADSGVAHDDQVAGKHGSTFDDHLKSSLGALTPGGKAPVVPGPVKPSSCPVPVKAAGAQGDLGVKQALFDAAPQTTQTELVSALAPTGATSCLLAGPRPVLRRGSSGEPVVTLQIELNFTGTRPELAEDGKFGPLTSAGVTEFQRRESLDPDGIVGAKTWARLDALADAQGESETGPGGGRGPTPVAGPATQPGTSALTSFVPGFPGQVAGPIPAGQVPGGQLPAGQVPGGAAPPVASSLPATGVPLVTSKGRFLRFPAPAGHTNNSDRPQFLTDAAKMKPYSGAGAAGAQVHPAVNSALDALIAAMHTEGATQDDESLKQASVSIGFRPSALSEGQLYLGALRKTITVNPTVFGGLTFPAALEAEAVSELGFTGSAKHDTFRDHVGTATGWTAALAQKLVSMTAQVKAPRGGSTHHSGVVLDISWPYAINATTVLSHDTKRERNADALRSAAGVWMNANAPTFGFDSYNTGVEIWHQEWRRWRGTAADPASP